MGLVFSTEEGHALCDRCDKDLDLTAPDMFWQLLKEKELVVIITHQQPSQSSTTGLSISSPRTLTYVEENDIRH